MDILERYPGRYDVLDFYGRKVAEEFAASMQNPIATKKNSTASTKPGGPSGCGHDARHELRSRVGLVDRHRDHMPSTRQPQA